MTLKHLTLTLRESLATKAVRSPAGHSLSLESTTSSLSLLAPAGVDITSQSGHVNIQVSKRLAAVIIASCVSGLQRRGVPRPGSQQPVQDRRWHHPPAGPPHPGEVSPTLTSIGYVFFYLL